MRKISDRELKEAGMNRRDLPTKAEAEDMKKFMERVRNGIETYPHPLPTKKRRR